MRPNSHYLADHTDSAGVTVLVIDSYLACGRLLPLVRDLIRQKRNYLILYDSQFEVEAHIREYEQLLGSRVDALNIDKVGGWWNRHILRRIARWVAKFSGITFVRVISKWLMCLQWQSALRTVFDHTRIESVIVVSTLKLFFGRLCLREAWRRQIHTINLMHRVVSKRDVILLNSQSINRTTFRLRSHLRKLCCKLLLRSEKYVEDDDSMILAIWFSDLFLMKVFLPEEGEFFWPLSSYASVNIGHPALKLHLNGEEVVPPMRLLYQVSPEEDMYRHMLVASPSAEDAFEKTWREILQSLGQQNERLIIYSYVDFFSEKVAHSLEHELNLHANILRQLNAIGNATTIVTRHPRVLYRQMVTALGTLNLPNVRLSPCTGMMLVPHCDVCVCVPASELNIFAAFYGAASVVSRHPITNDIDPWAQSIIAKYRIEVAQSVDDIGRVVAAQLCQRPISRVRESAFLLGHELGK